MNGSARWLSLKRFEQFRGLDTALNKNVVLLVAKVSLFVCHAMADIRELYCIPSVLPTQANQPVNHQEHPIDLSTEDIFQGLEEFDVGADIFSSLTCPDGSPKNNSAPGSPNHVAGSGMPMMNGASKIGGTGSLSDIQDEEHNLLQQPLAMGFYVSTASTGPLPRWFWGRCPEREDICPTCFKVRAWDTQCVLHLCVVSHGVCFHVSYICVLHENIHLCVVSHGVCFHVSYICVLHENMHLCVVSHAVYFHVLYICMLCHMVYVFMCHTYVCCVTWCMFSCVIHLCDIIVKSLLFISCAVLCCSCRLLCCSC